MPDQQSALDDWTSDDTGDTDTEADESHDEDTGEPHTEPGTVAPTEASPTDPTAYPRSLVAHDPNDHPPEDCYADRVGEWDRSVSHVHTGDVCCPFCRYPPRYWTVVERTGATVCTNCSAAVPVDAEWWPDPVISVADAVERDRKRGRSTGE